MSFANKGHIKYWASSGGPHNKNKSRNKEEVNFLREVIQTNKNNISHSHEFSIYVPALFRTLKLN